jgi:energy-coupling factor transporter ATP-binding protein EcfA2
VGFHILRHIVEHFQILKVVEITPDGNFNLITGANGEGKSSLLKSIMVALKGKTAAPDKPVTDGESKCIITTDIGTGQELEFTIRRVITAKGGFSVEVTTKAGKAIGSPQEFLNALIGDLTFDPLAFMHLKGAEQVNRLLQAVGLDPVASDQRKKELSQERLLVGREVKRLQGAIDSTPRPTARPDDAPIDIDAIKTSGRDVIARQETARAAKSDLDALKIHLSNVIREQDQVNNEIGRLNTKLKTIQKDIEETNALVVRAEANLPEMPSTESIVRELEEAQLHNQAIQDAIAYSKMAEELRAQSKSYDDFTRQIEALETEKTLALKKAKLPIDGLTFSAEELLLNNIPLQQASMSQQLKIGVAIAMALNPRLQIMLVEDASLFDSESLEYLRSLVTERGFQLFAEKVDESGTVGFVMEDGEIVATNPPTAAAPKRTKKPKAEKPVSELFEG